MSRIIATVRNVFVYLVGVVLLGVGALGLVSAIDLNIIIGGVLFVAGTALVLVVHEYLDGPIESP